MRRFCRCAASMPSFVRTKVSCYLGAWQGEECPLTSDYFLIMNMYSYLFLCVFQSGRELDPRTPSSALEHSTHRSSDSRGVVRASVLSDPSAVSAGSGGY